MRTAHSIAPPLNAVSSRQSAESRKQMLFILTPDSCSSPTYHLPPTVFTIQHCPSPTYHPSLSAAACQETQSPFPLSGPNLPPAGRDTLTLTAPEKGIGLRSVESTFVGSVILLGFAEGKARSGKNRRTLQRLSALVTQGSTQDGCAPQVWVETPTIF